MTKKVDLPPGSIRVWLGDDPNQISVPVVIPEGDKAFTLILPEHGGTWHHKTETASGEWVYGR